MEPTPLPLRTLRNQVSDVLRRVEAGERFEVTVDRRPVAALVPLDRRPTWVQGSAARDFLLGHQADAGLTAELAELFPDTTDDVGA